jgi:hypothetical protein
MFTPSLNLNNLLRDDLPMTVDPYHDLGGPCMNALAMFVTFTAL